MVDVPSLFVAPRATVACALARTSRCAPAEKAAELVLATVITFFSVSRLTVRSPAAGVYVVPLSLTMEKLLRSISRVLAFK